MTKWIQELNLLCLGAMLVFVFFVVMYFRTDDPTQKVRWEAYAAACLIGATFGRVVARLASAQAAALTELERRVGEIEAK